MTAPRICLLSSEYLPLRGGIGTYAREMGLAAASLGADVTLWAPSYDGAAAADEHDGDMRVRRFPGAQHSSKDVPRKLMAAWRASAEHFDLVHAADWPFYLPLGLLPRARARRRLVTLHGTEANQMAKPARRAVLQGLRWTRQIDAFLCNSHFTRDLFLRAFPEASPRTRVTLLGTSRFWLAPARERLATRTALGLKPDDLAVITVGRLTPRKGHLRTLAALSRLPPGLRERVVWLVVGPTIETDYVADVRSAIEAAPVRGLLLGERSDEELRDLYAASDLFCLTGQPHDSKVEGFGLVFLEAGGAGVPAVTTRTGGVPDAVLDGETGLLSEAGSDGDIAGAIARCLGDDAFRNRLAVNARAYADKLSWQLCAASSYDLPLPASGPLTAAQAV